MRRLAINMQYLRGFMIRSCPELPRRPPQAEGHHSGHPIMNPILSLSNLVRQRVPQKGEPWPSIKIF
jgi:hypothetical protein